MSAPNREKKQKHRRLQGKVKKGEKNPVRIYLSLDHKMDVKPAVATWKALSAKLTQLDFEY